MGNSNLFGRPPSPPWHLSLGQSCDGLSVGDVMCGGEELDAAEISCGTIAYRHLMGVAQLVGL